MWCCWPSILSKLQLPYFFDWPWAATRAIYIVPWDSTVSCDLTVYCVSIAPWDLTVSCHLTVPHDLFVPWDLTVSCDLLVACDLNMAKLFALVLPNASSASPCRLSDRPSLFSQTLEKTLASLLQESHRLWWYSHFCFEIWSERDLGSSSSLPTKTLGKSPLP